MLRRPAAVKILDAWEPKSIQRFEREVQLTSQLSHPSTVAIYDFGRTEDGGFYYAMEHLEGIDLADMIQFAGPLPPARVVHILRQVCGSLAEAHAKGLVHRDIKPSNIMLTVRGGEADVVKVVDFGLARLVDRRSGAEAHEGRRDLRDAGLHPAGGAVRAGRLRCARATSTRSAPSPTSSSPASRRSTARATSTSGTATSRSFRRLRASGSARRFRPTSKPS